MNLDFALGTIFVLSLLYAVVITVWDVGLRFARSVDWLAFAIGELLIIVVVSRMGCIDAISLFLLNAAGAFPMVIRWFYLNDKQEHRRELRATYAATQSLADRSRTTED